MTIKTSSLISALLPLTAIVMAITVLAALTGGSLASEWTAYWTKLTRSEDVLLPITLLLAGYAAIVISSGTIIVRIRTNRTFIPSLGFIFLAGVLMITANPMITTALTILDFMSGRS